MVLAKERRYTPDNIHNENGENSHPLDPLTHQNRYSLLRKHANPGCHAPEGVASPIFALYAAMDTGAVTYTGGDGSSLDQAVIDGVSRPSS
jgi:hypothetical protein